MRTIASFSTTGCWARVVRNPEKEVKILAKREGQSPSLLVGHDHIDTVGYTFHSSCTYVHKNVGVRLFDWQMNKHFALLIQPSDRPIDWWYNGRREIVTDEIKSVPGERYHNGADNIDQRWNCNIEDVQRAVLSLRNEYARDVYYHENPAEPVTMNWNEGFIRHQRNDIVGIIVRPDLKSSVMSALAFRKALQIPVHFYTYDQRDGTCSLISSLKLCQKHGIDSSAQLIIDHAVLRYQKIWNKKIKKMAANFSKNAMTL